MVTKEFAEASAELIEILNYLPKNEVEKIPLKLREFLIKVAAPNCKGRINPDKAIEEQDIKEKTKDLLTVIYRNYWCNEEERRELDRQLLENDKKYEEELRERYNPDNIFKNKTMEENRIAVVEEQKWYHKIINTIKKWLKIKNK